DRPTSTSRPGCSDSGGPDTPDDPTLVEVAGQVVEVAGAGNERELFARRRLYHLHVVVRNDVLALDHVAGVADVRLEHDLVAGLERVDVGENVAAADALHVAGQHDVAAGSGERRSLEVAGDELRHLPLFVFE